MHSFAGTTLQNADSPTPSRDSMQLFVVEKHDTPVGSQWLVRAVMNARKVTLERQAFWDIFARRTPSVAQHDWRGSCSSFPQDRPQDRLNEDNAHLPDSPAGEHLLV
jgi:hypothetical protein